MNPAEYNALHIIHVFSVLGMAGAVFYATAGAAETRKKVLMWSGIASLLALATGARMAFGIYHGMPGWVWVKLICWLALSAFVGVAYKRREKAGLWVWLTLIFAALALVMVYTRPF
jgi:hypothetical protein